MNTCPSYWKASGETQIHKQGVLVLWKHYDKLTALLSEQTYLPRIFILTRSINTLYTAIFQIRQEKSISINLVLSSYVLLFFAD